MIREEEAQTAKEPREEALKQVTEEQTDLSKVKIARKFARVEKL
jgi:hypothetical protein